MEQLLERIRKIENGFKHIIDAGDVLLADKTYHHFDLAVKFAADDSYQVRMLATYLLGQLAPKNPHVLQMLETQIADDGNWRVQEMLAKALDHYCKSIGYKQSLATIQKWLSDKKANVKRAVIEGLRIWTSRPYFKEHPAVALQLISAHRSDDSEYLRRSVGNALRDIRKKHPDEVSAATATWDLADKKTAFTYKLTQTNK